MKVTVVVIESSRYVRVTLGMMLEITVEGREKASLKGGKETDLEMVPRGKGLVHRRLEVRIGTVSPSGRVAGVEHCRWIIMDLSHSARPDTRSLGGRKRNSGGDLKVRPRLTETLTRAA